MTIHREFLGWQDSCLDLAAKWLKRRYSSGHHWDMGRVVVVVPGRRSGRRLLEVLVSHAQGHLLTPPTITTTGELPELLYEPDLPIATPITALLARIYALQHAEDVPLIVPQPPNRDDLNGYIPLARDLAALDKTLATDVVPLDEVIARCQQETDFTDHSRWQALAQLQRDYEQVLAQHGLQDPNAARLEAVRRRRCTTERDVVLLATTDLHKIARQMLEQVSHRVTALIHAPPSCADDFDHLGGLIVDKWVNRQIDLDPSMVRIVDRPRDQGLEVLKTIERIASDQYGADQITVGLGDETAGPMLHRSLELAGVPARLATGRPLLQSRPALLLSALAKVGDGQRTDDFAALLRHPDLQSYLTDQLGQVDDEGGFSRSHTDVSWPTWLDRYATDHLQQCLKGHWLGDDSNHVKLKAAYELITTLLGEHAEMRKPLPEWSRAMARMLIAVYESLELDRRTPEEADLLRALEAIGKVLGDLDQLAPANLFTPHLTASEAMTLTLNCLANQEIPPEGGTPAVELMGWLELQLDDAPVLIITTVNEGYIPGHANADAFLPDHTRQILGLEDNRRRYARDMMMLCAITSSRDHVTLITGRRTDDDQPLAPSRLLLACDEARIAQTVHRFYNPETNNDQADKPLLLIEPGAASRLMIPPPHRPDRPMTQLPVTAFRDYLACPYRFYLKHVLKLKTLDDQAVEMDGRAFGNLAHEVLERFGHSDLARSTRVTAIQAFLSNQLDDIANQRFGRDRFAAVAVQCEQLRYRLNLFAHWQVLRTEAGWRIVPDHIEEKIQATIQVDGNPFTITGRIDRIDIHDDLGYSILDYKTSDTANDPQKMHRIGPKDNKIWIDLQLPLYRKLAYAIGIDCPAELGYIHLPKDQPKLALANWQPETFDSADAELDRIIRAIWAGMFWPPTDTPRYLDEFSALCLDGCPDRPGALARSGEQLRQTKGQP